MTHPKLRYIGTKQILAVAMTRGAYNILRGWTLPADENGEDEGYLVEYLDGGKPNLEGYAGYVSWSPKEVFEYAYRPIQNFAMDTAAADTIEEMIKAAGATAPRVTPDKLREVIASVAWIRPLGTLMLCIVTLRNGFNVVGQSACVDPANFREEIGRRISYENAIRQIWPLEGYLLAQVRATAPLVVPEGSIPEETMKEMVQNPGRVMFREEGTLDQLAPGNFEEPKAS